MTYGSYAPFYRGSYFNPMQTAPMQNVTDGQNQFSQPYQAPVQTPQIPLPNQPANEMIWVLNENEATSYPVAPNNSVVLWDKNNPTIYVKSVNAQGVPSMRVLDFTERTENQQKSTEGHVCHCGDRFVTKEVFSALEGKINDLQAKYDALTEKPKAKTNKPKGDDE